MAKATRAATVLLVAMGAMQAAAADAAEFRAVLGGWGYHITGTTLTDGQSYDLERDLQLHGSRRRSGLIEYDTPRGWIPDVAVGYSQLGASGSRSSSMTIGGIPLPPGTQSVTASADFDDYDLTLRYPYRWGPVCFMGGLTVKHLAGEVDIDDSTQPEPSHQSYDEFVPMLHAGMRWRLGSLLTLVGAGQGISAGDSRAIDWRATAEVRVLAPLLVEVGWQQKRYDIQVEDYALDATLEGLLVRIGFLYR
jgi:outer membrane protein